MSLSHLAPHEIDGMLESVGRDCDHLEKLFYEACDSMRFPTGDTLPRLRKRNSIFLRLRRTEEPITGYGAEYLRQRWSRYYATLDRLVHNWDGACPHPEGFQAWLTHDSGKSPEAMHLEYGGAMCPKCFPQFPDTLWRSDREITNFAFPHNMWAVAADHRIQTANSGGALKLSSGVRVSTVIQGQRLLYDNLEFFYEQKRVSRNALPPQATANLADAVVLAQALAYASGCSANQTLAEAKRHAEYAASVKYPDMSSAATA